MFCFPLALFFLILFVSLSFWLIKWLSYVEYVECLSTGQLSGALECCCTRNISMSFTICFVYCHSFVYVILFFGSIRNIYKCIWMARLTRCFIFRAFRLLLFDFYGIARIILCAPFLTVNDSGLMSHGRVVDHNGVQKDLFVWYIHVYKQTSMAMKLSEIFKAFVNVYPPYKY